MVLSVQTSPAQLQEDLSKAYHDAVRRDGLIDFTKKIREDSKKYSIKQNQLANLFSKNVWSDVKTKSGHRKLMNIMTGVVVEYVNHAKDVDPGAASGILEAVQKHLNLLCNTIFKYEGNNWKKEPDYQASAKRWYQWRQS